MARACATYAADDERTDPFKHALQRYKYGPDVSLAPALTRLMIRHCTLEVSRYDLIIAVPLHLSRLRWRGFNQALLLAHGVARRFGCLLDPFALERVRATDPQVELDERARRRNVAGAFRVSSDRRVAGRRVLLIDDVYTTGATADECSRTLKRAGAVYTDVLVLARAVLH
ncbi:MAG: ComF family protein [Deltaproteobacteria bacterium]|nr:ComF family protein [Deltaproteobacteria bacterium]